MSSTPPKNHSALKAVLSVMCALLALGGLFLVFAAGSWIVKWLIPDANAQTAVWMLVMLKAFGALALFLAYLLYHAARDPVRHATTITGLAYMLILLAALDVYAAYALGFAGVYPIWAIWARAAVRVALAIVLLTLRPRAAAA